MSKTCLHRDKLASIQTILRFGGVLMNSLGIVLLRLAVPQSYLEPRLLPFFSSLPITDYDSFLYSFNRVACIKPTFWWTERKEGRYALFFKDHLPKALSTISVSHPYARIYHVSSCKARNVVVFFSQVVVYQINSRDSFTVEGKNG